MSSVKTKPLNQDQANSLSQLVAQYLCSGDVIALCGDLGAGKTTFVSMLTSYMEPEPGVVVTSPTYVIHHVYPAKIPIHHIDLFRLEDKRVVDVLGFEEFLGEQGVTLIEWFEKFPKLWDGPLLWMHIKITDSNHRIYEFDSRGQVPHWEKMMQKIKDAF